MKKILILFVFLFLLCGCNNKPLEKELISINIIQLPNKLSYYVDEEIDLNDIKIEGTYNNGDKIIIDNYEIDYETLKLGKNLIYIKYDNLITSFEIEIKEKQLISINIIQLPSKLSYYVDEEIDLNDIKVEGTYNNGDKIIIDNYEIDYETLKLGKNVIYIKYDNLITSFEIEIKEKEKIKLLDYLDFTNKTIKNINYLEYDKKYDNVIYGVTRNTDMFIAYDEHYFVNTNIYGYEVAVNKYGIVVEKGVNVSLPNDGLVLSAHGKAIQLIKEIELGDIVYYSNESVYIYKDEIISKNNQVFMMFYEYLDYIEKINNIDTYNEFIERLNNLIPKLNNFYNYYGENIKNELIENLYINNEESFDNENHSYSYCNIEFYNLEEPDINNLNFSFFKQYNEQLYIGGFRNTNTLVYYDKDCYRSRNRYGYEVGVDKNGIVVSKETLVDLEEEGYILSGHGTGAEFIINNININDKIEIIENKVYIYRDFKSMHIYNYTNLRNDLVNAIKTEYELEIPHDYEFLNNLIFEIDNQINALKQLNLNLDEMMQTSKIINTLGDYIAIGYSQIIEYDATKSRGIWYYPFRTPKVYDDTTKEGVIKTIEQYKKAGFNEIIIYLFVENECLFDSTMYKQYHKLSNYNYGEYGNDYLKCFIEECHKRDILVNAFTQTFHGYVDSMKNKKEEYYQIDYQGNKSLGNIFYFDICNDNLQGEIVNWYKELVSKYNFDKVEYDIIRYPNSNLQTYLDVDIISDPSKIQDHGYTEYSMEKFLTTYNLEGDLKELIVTDKEVRKKWLEFKEQNLVDFITKCSDEMKKISPNLIVTAAVFSNYNEAKKSYLQDYKKWLELTIVDDIEIMLYTPSTNYLIDTMDKLDDLYKQYTVRTGVSVRLDDRNIISDFNQLYLTSKKDGYIIFSSTLYNDEKFMNILSNNHHQPFLNELSNPEEVLNQKILNVIDMIENYYSVINQKSYDTLINQLKLKNNYIEIIENLDDELMKNYLLDKLG